MAMTYPEDSQREDPRSFSTLLSRLVRDISDLVRQEIALAKTEAAEKASSLVTGLVAVVIGGAVAFGGFLVLLDACVFALGNVLGSDLVDRFPALPALIVGLVVAVIGAVMIKLGANKFTASNLRLSRTMDSMRRDQAVAREHLS